MIDSTDAASRLSRLVKYGSGSLTSRDFADLAAVLDELRELRGFRWEEWGVELEFEGAVTTVEHPGEFGARRHYRQLRHESPRRAKNLSLVRRTHVQGNWTKVETEEDEC